jgi:hypothetical protein
MGRIFITHLVDRHSVGRNFVSSRYVAVDLWPSASSPRLKTSVQYDIFITMKNGRRNILYFPSFFPSSFSSVYRDTRQKYSITINFTKRRMRKYKREHKTPFISSFLRKYARLQTTLLIKASTNPSYRFICVVGNPC